MEIQEAKNKAAKEITGREFTTDMKLLNEVVDRAIEIYATDKLHQYKAGIIVEQVRQSSDKEVVDVIPFKDFYILLLKHDSDFYTLLLGLDASGKKYSYISRGEECLHVCLQLIKKHKK